MNDYFKTALKDFTSDVAYKDSIRHLAKKGMSVEQISRTLTYPVSTEVIKNTVWKYYIDSGLILLNKPEGEESLVTKSSFILERDQYGRTSYRKVEEVVCPKPQEYLPCDFGKLMYQNKDAFIKKLSVLERNDVDYVLGLPWPLSTVYHQRNERIIRILQAIK